MIEEIRMTSAFNNPTCVDIEYKTMFFLAMILLLEEKNATH